MTDLITALLLFSTGFIAGRIILMGGIFGQQWKRRQRKLNLSPHVVIVVDNDELIEQIEKRRWLYEVGKESEDWQRAGHTYTGNTTAYQFRKAEDAVAFKLRWGGADKSE